MSKKSPGHRRREAEATASPGPRWQALTSRRVWNIALRTIHIGVAGALFGGHVFDTAEGRLLPWLYATIVTGGCLILVEGYPHLYWCYQIRGLLVLAELLLLCLIPWFWDDRVAILAVVIVIACVGSHMPGKYRYYSVVHRRVLEGSKRS